MENREFWQRVYIAAVRENRPLNQLSTIADDAVTALEARPQLRLAALTGKPVEEVTVPVSIPKPSARV